MTPIAPPGPLWQPAYIGLGANLGDPGQTLRSARDALAALPACRLEAFSPVYRSAPLGPADQPDYLNAVAGLLTQLAPATLLARLHDIEARHGRTRDGARWGPRTLDLDLLMHGAMEVDTPDLTLPHPGVAERAFVLVPLAQIAPFLLVPGAGRVCSLLRRVDVTDLIRLAC